MIISEVETRSKPLAKNLEAPFPNLFFPCNAQAWQYLVLYMLAYTETLFSTVLYRPGNTQSYILLIIYLAL